MRRFAPTFSEHIARYAFALPYCRKRNVLDLGSKDGFGSFVMSYMANKIDLADISPKFLQHAKNLTYNCPVDFHIVDFEKEFPKGEWDTMVAFEVIEHIENVDFFIRNISEHLKPGGYLVFSVPHMVANKDHKTLFDEEGIKNLISKYLTLEEFYIQDKKTVSNLPTHKGLKCYVGIARKK